MNQPVQFFQVITQTKNIQRLNSEVIDVELYQKNHKKFSLDYLIDQKEEQTKLEIDVKPRKKVFQNEQEKNQFVYNYQQKIKTELCKNYQMKKQCKFGDKCCFAHGKSELRSKIFQNRDNYKQKPCKKFFLFGFCNYGQRCQYLHSDINLRPEFFTFLLNIQKTKCNTKNHTVQFPNTKLLKLEKLCLQFLKQDEKDIQFEKLFQNMNIRRLPFFQTLCEEQQKGDNMQKSIYCSEVTTIRGQ